MSFTLAVKYLAWLAAVLTAILQPSAGETFFGRLERQFHQLARHRTGVWLGLGLLVLLIRGALLPFWPIPKPVIYDEFSYILQADTFAHGRLANPTHPLWQFFESAYVLQHPTYAAKYPPAQAMFLAAGQVLFGEPWFGVWLSCGVMLAALCWAMQGWLPPSWALLGGLLGTPLAIASYWMNSYWGGAVAAIGGALVLGGFARVIRQKKPVYGLAIGLGVAILANSRPYEGLIFCLPVAILFLLARPRWTAFALIVAVLIPAAVLTGYYNYRVTGNALRMPFIEYATQYVHIPLFNFQPLLPSKVYKTQVMYDLHHNWEREEWEKARTPELLSIRLTDWKIVATDVLGGVMPGGLILVFSLSLFRDRRIRLPLLCVIAALAGSLVEVRYYPHYAAPATAAMLILAVQALRHLRQWQPGKQPAGRLLARTIPVLVVGSVMASQLVVLLRQEPPENFQSPNARRDQVAALINQTPGRHVILVHYTNGRVPHEEWVYNGADIDSQDVIWAHDLGVVDNARIVEYYKDRKIWRLQPDISVTMVDPYK